MREMKDTSVFWCPTIPTDWSTIKNKYILSLLYSGGTPSAGDEKFYTLDNGVPFVSISDMSSVAYVKSTKKQVTDLGIADKRLIVLPKGTILYSIYATVGAVSELEIEATISQAMLALQVNDSIYKPFYKYNLLAMREYVLSDTNGNTQFNLNAEKVRNFVFILPPMKDQQIIAAHLDRKCTQIDALISNAQQQIEKLKAYKQSVITETVTKGLDPDVKMKDSGVEWIGEIPGNAELTKVSHLFNVILGKMVSPTKSKADETLESYFCAANVHFDDLQYDELKTMWFDSNEKETYLVQKGDLLVVEGGAGAGGSHIVEKDIENCYVQNSVMIVRRKKHVPEKWLYYIIYMLVKNNYIDYVCNKATIPHFTKDKLNNTPVVFYKEEQMKKMIVYLDRKCTQIDQLIALKQQKIEKLQQYKKSLIYEYVTGKKEV